MFLSLHFSGEAHPQRVIMTTDTAAEPQALQPTILSYVKDLPNLCSLAGLASDFKV